MHAQADSLPGDPISLRGKIAALLTVRFAWLWLWLGLLAFVAAADGSDPTNQNTTATIAHTGRGFTYQNDRIAGEPWSVHIVAVDRSRTDLKLHTTLAKGTIFGMSALSEQVKSLPGEFGRPVAAVNGDFYRDDRKYSGDPKGLQILDGELVSAPCDWSCFWIDTAGEPHMSNVVSLLQVRWPTGAVTPFGLNEERDNNAAVLYTPRLGSSTRSSGGRELILERADGGPWLPLAPGQTYHARVREIRHGDTSLTPDIMVLSLGPQLATPAIAPGAVLKLSTGTAPDLSGVKTAIGGGPALVRNGKVIAPDTNPVRHPRTAIGWNKDRFFMVAVDGRQRNLSVGMTYVELAEYMAKLGCAEALNLDGGGSTTCWVLGQVMNSPSEGHERNMANALVLVHKEKK